MWTDARVKRMVVLWEGGFSAAYIAADIGGVSRNAVIGKVHRMGLRRRDEPNQFNGRNMRKKGPRGPNKAKGVSGPAIVTLAPTRLDLPDEDTPQGPLVSFDELEPHHCRAPYGDPRRDGFGFCGCERVLGKPYCQEHMQRLYVAPPATRPNANPARPGVFAPPMQHEIDEVVS